MEEMIIYVTINKVNAIEFVNFYENFYDTWYFRYNERIRNVPDEDINHENAFVGYRAKISTLRRRLNLAGWTIETVQEHFDDCLHSELVFNKSRPHISPDKVKLMQKYPDVKLWISCLSEIIVGVSEREDEKKGADLLEYMKSGMSECMGENYYNPQDLYNFPCIDPNCWAVVLLSIFDDNEFCELNLTDFLRKNKLTDFNDYTEGYKAQSESFSNFLEFYKDIYLLPKQYENQPILSRLLFSSVISAVESYLSEVLKEKVIKNESVKRSFVKNHSSFNEKKKISISEIYIKLDELEKSIPDELDKIIYHRIEVVSGLYKNVLKVSFLNEYISEINKAIEIRHDIVHRNGKTNEGESVIVTSDMVTRLLTISKEFLSDIDKQVIDGFLY